MEESDLISIIFCKEAVSSQANEKDESMGMFSGLKISTNTSKLILGFNIENLFQTIPYFIYCLKNNREYTIQTSRNNYITIHKQFVEFYMIDDDESNPSESNICIPLMNCRKQLINQLSKTNYEASDGYFNLMNTLHRNDSVYLLFIIGKLQSNIPRKNNMNIIDEFSEEDENKFRQLLNTGKEVKVQEIIYRTHTESPNLIQSASTTDGCKSMAYHKDVIIDALNHIYESE